MNNTLNKHDKQARKTGFVLYHLPGYDDYTELQQGHCPRTIASYEELTTLSGFAIAPFHMFANVLPLLIEPDFSRSLPLPPCPSLLFDQTLLQTQEEEDKDRSDYHRAFRKCKELLTRGICKKIVLSRTCKLHYPNALMASRSFFFKACHLYPDCFTTLFSTPQTGTWLISTPETLVEKEKDGWNTMSLAGTMKCESETPSAVGNWADKNRKEQEMVTNFIKSQLQDMACEIRTKGPFVHKIGTIAHLRTDFHFQLYDTYGLGDLLHALHPTPATCGIPCETAKNAILSFETSPRRCYAGFCGPIQMLGETRLYVSLRCMEIQKDEVCLHAGGGLLPESQEIEEWAETQHKMQSIKNICSATTTV